MNPLRITLKESWLGDVSERRRGMPVRNSAPARGRLERGAKLGLEVAVGVAGVGSRESGGAAEGGGDALGADAEDAAMFEAAGGAEHLAACDPQGQPAAGVPSRPGLFPSPGFLQAWGGRLGTRGRRPVGHARKNPAISPV